MNPFKEHLQKKDKVAVKHRAHKVAGKKGLVVDRLLLPEFSLHMEYPDMRHDN